MKEFFIELFSEEIPFSLQQAAKEQIETLFKEKNSNYTKGFYTMSFNSSLGKDTL